MHCYLEAAESNCTTDKPKPGLKSVMQYFSDIKIVISSYIGGCTKQMHNARGLEEVWQHTNMHKVQNEKCFLIGGILRLPWMVHCTL